MKDRNELASFLYHRSVVNPHVGYDDLSARLRQEWLAYADEIMGFLGDAPAASEPNVQPIFAAGALMANAMFNLSQRGEMTDAVRAQMREMQQGWDKARAAYDAATSTKDVT